MDVLILMSIVTVMFALERAWFLARTGGGSRLITSLSAHIRNDDGAAALEACRTDGSYLGRVGEALLRTCSLNRNEMDRAVDATIEREKVSMEKHLTILGTMSNIAPAMGLFGTIVGIIRLSRDVAASGSGGTSVIATGVSEALLTTAVGILVAVIATVCHDLCMRRVRVRSVAMDGFREELITLLAERSRARANHWATSRAVIRRAA